VHSIPLVNQWCEIGVILSDMSRHARPTTVWPDLTDLHSTSRQKVPILYNRRPFPQNYPFPRGSGPHVRHDSLDPSEPTDQTASLSV